MDAQPPARYNELLPSPAQPLFRLAVVEFAVPGAPNGGSDKGPDGHRIDTIPIANGVIKAGAACDLLRYECDQHEAFAAALAPYDALLVRVNPGQLSQNTPEGTQERFDALMTARVNAGVLVFSAPAVQTGMGAKDALVRIRGLSCGLPDTLAYYTPEELEAGFKQTMAFQPRVVKQNRGSSGEGIWLCWLEDKPYCAQLGDAVLEDGDRLKVMEMNDTHVEYHTVKEFLTYCTHGPEHPDAGVWTSKSGGKYLEGGHAAGAQLVDQRLLPRVSEGEVRMLMVGDALQLIIHKQPINGGFSSVINHATYSFFKVGSAQWAELENKFLREDVPQLMRTLQIEREPLPLLWTADFIPMDGETAGSTKYVVGEFNCSCVGISQLQSVRGGSKCLADVSDEDYHAACELTDLMGRTAVKVLQDARAAQASTGERR